MPFSCSVATPQLIPIHRAPPFPSHPSPLLPRLPSIESSQIRYPVQSALRCAPFFCVTPEIRRRAWTRCDRATLSAATVARLDDPRRRAANYRAMRIEAGRHVRDWGNLSRCTSVPPCVPSRRRLEIWPDWPWPSVENKPDIVHSDLRFRHVERERENGKFPPGLRVTRTSS